MIDKMEINKIYCGNNLDILKTFPDESIDCCITSPPYYGLRDYGTGHWVGGDPNCPHKRLNKVGSHTSTGHAQEELKGNVGDSIYKSVCPLCGAARVDEQIGLEETPEEYVNRLVEVFREVKRVLKEDGTLWLNIGDSYCGTGDKGSYKDPKYPDGRNGQAVSINKNIVGYKSKDLIGIPWMLAFALRADGWYLRQDIIWHKPNPMPESVKDRCTKAHEYIFLLSKSPKYYFDYEAIQEDAVSKPHKPGNKMHKDKISGPNDRGGHSQWEDRMDKIWGNEKKNKRDVWSISTKPFKGAHFATFPEELVENCLLAGCPVNGVVLDPFMGSGTVGLVAKNNYRNYVGIDLNPKYIDIANARIDGIDLVEDKSEEIGVKVNSLW